MRDYHGSGFRDRRNTGRRFKILKSEKGHAPLIKKNKLKKAICSQIWHVLRTQDTFSVEELFGKYHNKSLRLQYVFGKNANETQLPNWDMKLFAKE